MAESLTTRNSGIFNRETESLTVFWGLFSEPIQLKSVIPGFDGSHGFLRVENPNKQI